MRKIPAFTLMEIMIVMIISGIVISFGYSAYTFIQSRSGTFSEITRRDVSLQKTVALLERDVFRSCRIIALNGNELLFVGEDTVDYHFNPEYLLRRSGTITDTFNIPVNKCSFQFQRETLTEGLVDKIDLSIRDSESGLIEMGLSKKYDASALMEYHERGYAKY